MSSFYARQRARESERHNAGIGSSKDADKLSSIGTYQSDQNGSSIEKRLNAYREQIERLKATVLEQQAMIERLSDVVKYLTGQPP